MNYQKSDRILKEIKMAKRILLNCHRGPDPDGIGSTLAMEKVLSDMGEDVEIICPTKPISTQTSYLEGYSKIRLGIDYSTFDFAKFDLFITLDTPNKSLLTGSDNSPLPNIKTIVIDHHHISTLEGFIKLVDEEATSVGEMLFDIFEDWGVPLDKGIAECLLTSIIGDTGAFAYPNVTSKTLNIASKLMNLGADKKMIVDRIYRNEDFEMLKFWSLVLEKMEIDKNRKFVYSVVSYDEYKQYAKLDDAKAKAASLFAPIVAGSDFGFIAVEERPKYQTVSFRGRTDFDTSKIAKALGGGGHKVASAAKIEGLEFEKAKELLLKTVREVVDENKD